MGAATRAVRGSLGTHVPLVSRARALHRGRTAGRAARRPRAEAAYQVLGKKRWSGSASAASRTGCCRWSGCRSCTPDLLEFGPSALVLVADAMEDPGQPRHADPDPGRGPRGRAGADQPADPAHPPEGVPRITGDGAHRAVVEFASAPEAVRWLGSPVPVCWPTPTRRRRTRRWITRGGGRARRGLGASGISPGWYEHGFERVAVPMLGTADSLNVSVSASGCSTRRGRGSPAGETRGRRAGCTARPGHGSAAGKRVARRDPAPVGRRIAKAHEPAQAYRHVLWLR